jgi:hypothetical protein
MTKTKLIIFCLLTFLVSFGFSFTISQVLAVINIGDNLDFGNNYRIRNLPPPANSDEPVTKGYFEQQIANLGGGFWAAISGTNDIRNTNTGKVGIGTTTPAYKLEVNNNADEILRLTRSGAATSVNFRVGTDSGFVLNALGKDMLVIKNTGIGKAVGIGGVPSSNPTATVHIYSDDLNIFPLPMLRLERGANSSFTILSNTYNRWNINIDDTEMLRFSPLSSPPYIYLPFGVGLRLGGENGELLKVWPKQVEYVCEDWYFKNNGGNCFNFGSDGSNFAIYNHNYRPPGAVYANIPGCGGSNPNCPWGHYINPSQCPMGYVHLESYCEGDCSGDDGAITICRRIE